MNHLRMESRIEALIEHGWAFLCDASHWDAQSRHSGFSGPLDRVGTKFVETSRMAAGTTPPQRRGRPAGASPGEWTIGGRTHAGRILGGLGISVLLAGCSTSASLTPTPPTPTGMVATPTVPTTPMTTPAPTPTPTSTARAFGPATVVSGIESCSLQDGTTTIVGESEQMRGATLTCTETVNDPRVSGTTEYTWNYDLWYDGRDFAHVQWGTGRIENAGGAWEGTFSGVYSSETHEDALTFWFTGTGGYEGLSYFMRVACGATPGFTVPTEGMIFPGEPPTP